MFHCFIQVGDVIYGKVVELPPDFPMELTCVHGTGKSLGLGVLESGHVFQVNKLGYNCILLLKQ